MPKPRTFGQATRSTLAVKFHEKGSFIKGIILGAPVEVQVTDINTGKPAYWDEEKTQPKMQWVFELLKVKETVCACDEWCDGGEKNEAYTSEDDDGIRKMYIASNRALKSISKAIRDSGVRSGEPEFGGLLVVQFSAYDKEAQKPGRKPPKVFSAQYARPTEETLAAARAVSSAPSDDDDDDSDAMWDKATGGSAKMSMDDMKLLNGTE